MLGRNQAGLDANYEQYKDGRDWSANRLGLLTNMLGSIKGGSQTGANPNYTSASQNAATWATILASMYGSS
jgi:hypothetical protein